MMNPIRLLLTGLLIIGLCTLSLAQKRAKQPIHVQKQLPDVAHLLTLFAGEFDNLAQVQAEKDAKSAEIHEHIHSIFAPVSLTALGPNVLYVKQYMDGNPKKIYRQRLYNFVNDPAEGAVRLDIFSFDTDSLYDNAHLHPEKLTNLTPARLTSTAGCAVYWKRDPNSPALDRYIGYMKDKACNFVSKRSGKRVFITDSLLLDRDQLWIRDEAFDEAGNYVFGHKGRIHHKLKRCQQYTGWFALEKTDGTNEHENARELVLYNPGGRQTLVTQNGKPTSYALELATLTNSQGQPVLTLTLYEAGTVQPLQAAWAAPDAPLIGLNTRWLSAALTRQETPAAVARTPKK